MKKYEGMFIIKPDMNQEDIDKTVASIESVITKNDGKVESSQKWARRQLAYAIKKYKEGEYYLFNFEAEPKAITTLEQAYKLNDNILRTLITAKEE
jgi:small subunit ribosomal protein S6